MKRRIAARPHDLKADEWIYNILAGGSKDALETLTDSWANLSWKTSDDGAEMQWAHADYVNRQFDNTFTDLGPSTTSDKITSTSDSNGLTEGPLIFRLKALAYYILYLYNSFPIPRF